MSNWQETFEKADISINTQGDNIVIAVPTSPAQYIAIDYLQYMVASAVNVQHKTDASTNYGGAYPLALGQAVTIENVMQNEHGVITCPSGKGFILNLSAPVQVSGFIRYRIVGK